MKNNELLLTIKFENDGEELSLLLNKDITVSSIIKHTETRRKECTGTRQ